MTSSLTKFSDLPNDAIRDLTTYLYPPFHSRFQSKHGITTSFFYSFRDIFSFAGVSLQTLHATKLQLSSFLHSFHISEKHHPILEDAQLLSLMRNVIPRLVGDDLRHVTVCDMEMLNNLAVYCRNVTHLKVFCRDDSNEDRKTIEKMRNVMFKNMKVLTLLSPSLSMLNIFLNENSNIRRLQKLELNDICIENVVSIVQFLCPVISVQNNLKNLNISITPSKRFSHHPSNISHEFLRLFHVITTTPTNSNDLSNSINVHITAPAHLALHQCVNRVVQDDVVRTVTYTFDTTEHNGKRVVISVPCVKRARTTSTSTIHVSGIHRIRSLLGSDYLHGMNGTKRRHRYSEQRQQQQQVVCVSGRRELLIDDFMLSSSSSSISYTPNSQFLQRHGLNFASVSSDQQKEDKLGNDEEDVQGIETLRIIRPDITFMFCTPSRLANLINQISYHAPSPKILHATPSPSGLHTSTYTTFILSLFHSFRHSLSTLRLTTSYARALHDNHSTLRSVLRCKTLERISIQGGVHVIVIHSLLVCLKEEGSENLGGITEIIVDRVVKGGASIGLVMETCQKVRNVKQELGWIDVGKIEKELCDMVERMRLDFEFEMEDRGKL